MAPHRTVCWTPLWNPHAPGAGMEHLQLEDRRAEGVVLAVDPAQGPFRLDYRLCWDAAWQLDRAVLTVAIGQSTRSLALHTDGAGRWWQDGGGALAALDGCRDIDIWPTPFTNSFPIHRAPLALGERRVFRMAWVSAPDLAVQPQAQAYTRLADRLYRFESLDGSGFTAELAVDGDGLVRDYPGLFRRLADTG